MNTVKDILTEVIGEWTPIAEGQHFAGIDIQWIACCAVLCVTLFSVFGIVRACVKR